MKNFKGDRSRAERRISYLLEQGTLSDLKNALSFTNDLLAYEWQKFYELEYQRNKIAAKLRSALLTNCKKNFLFKEWQRAVKWRYSLHPLSTFGSTKSFGQRFNCGEDINSSITAFHALYLAENKDTALQETLGQQHTAHDSIMSPRELALTNPESESIVSVSGKLDFIIDLTVPRTLNMFVSLVKDFKYSKDLQTRAKQLRLPKPGIAKDNNSLLQTLLDPLWRSNPAQYDIPANSQIFGKLVCDAGIDGILYPSRQTSKLCLAIFPINFEKGDSFIEFDHAPPIAAIPRRFDNSNFSLLSKGRLEAC